MKEMNCDNLTASAKLLLEHGLLYDSQQRLTASGVLLHDHGLLYRK
jgi:hypothetical protein